MPPPLCVMELEVPKTPTHEACLKPDALLGKPCLMKGGMQAGKLVQCLCRPLDDASGAHLSVIRGIPAAIARWAAIPIHFDSALYCNANAIAAEFCTPHLPIPA